MLIDRRLIATVLVALAAGWWLGSSPASPVNPNPPQPIRRAFAGVIRTAARLGLWIAVVGERPSPEPEQRQQLVRAPRVDADGHPVIDHREGW